MRVARAVCVRDGRAFGFAGFICGSWLRLPAPLRVRYNAFATVVYLTYCPSDTRFSSCADVLTRSALQLRAMGCGLAC